MTSGIAVWTLGNHAKRNLLPAIAASPSWHLAGVYSRNVDAANHVAAEYGVTTYKTPEAMLADNAVTAVVIAGPNGVHFAQAMAAISAGKHVFVEKTLAPSLDEVTALVRASEQAGVVLAECFMYRHHEQFRVLRELLRTGSLGPVRSITARFGFPHLADSDIRYSRALAGGALNDAGAYCISASLALMDSMPIAVSGALSSPEGHEVDTQGGALLEFADGATAHCDWGFGRAYSNQIELWLRDAMVSVERAFSKPADLITSIRVLHQRENRVEVLEVPADNHFVRMFEALAAATRERVLADVLRRELQAQAVVMHSVRSPDTHCAHGALPG